MGIPQYSLKDLIRARRHGSWAGRAKGYSNRNLNAGSCSASLRCHVCQFLSSGEAGKAYAVILTLFASRHSVSGENSDHREDQSSYSGESHARVAIHVAGRVTALVAYQQTYR